jgi:thioredoxin-like negative regulator of GroEL
MLSRRDLLLGASLTSLGFALPAQAGEIPFTIAEFEAAKKAGKPILVEIHASWCPTCKAQIPILAKLFATSKFADLVVLRVDFDQQKDIVRSFRAQIQSTLIVYKDGKEIARSVGDTNAQSIESLLNQAV